MRSLGFTLMLALIAALVCAVAGLQLREGGFESIFGRPATPVGEHLYASFTPDQVKHIRVVASGTSASFTLKENGWQASTPWQDRMDPRAAVGIINFTLGMRVEDVAHEDDVDKEEANLGDHSIRIRIEDENHQPLAKYRIGRVSPWKAEVEGMEQPVTTVFVKPRDENHDEHIYLCTGDITPLFKDGLKFLRDHRPFYFNPAGLQKIRIRSQEGDLTLGRETPDSPWRIVKPLDLPTDPAAIKALIEGLFELQAVKISERAAVTLPATDTSVKTSQIALTSFGSETETVLDIFPAESPEAQDVTAIVSDRPEVVFDLPAKPESDLISLADLPLTANELRDPTLTHLNIASLRAIAIQPSTGPEIIVFREPQKPWMVSAEGRTFEANEENLYNLLKAVTTSRVIGFESDAATDFTPWGLDRPILTLRFLGQNNQALELRFGLDPNGNYFVNRLGTPTVMQVDPTLIQAIAVRPYEWRPSLLWSVNRVNLSSIIRKMGSDDELILREYDFVNETWKAERNGKPATASLDPARANFMLSNLEGLKVSRWLATNDAGALAALASPSLTFTVFEKTIDDAGNENGVSIRTLTLAPAAEGANPGFYYGRLDSEAHPFLLDAATYQKLAVDLVGK
jgi:hypothetical protein